MKPNDFLSATLLISAVLVQLSVPQLIPTETRVLFQAQKQLEYPQVLHGWTNWTNFCYLPPSSSLTIVCSNNHITELTITGNRTSPVLSSVFSIDSFFTVLTKLSTLKSLSLTNLGLWGSLPSKINRFRSLESLNLSSNFIHGSIPNSIATFKNLNRLVLRNNLFNGSVPDLKNLTTLQELDLSYNLLGPEFPSLAKNRNLVNITLRNNKFTGPVSPSVFSLPSLQRLDIAENQITGIVPGNLCGGNVTYIDISSNRLVGKLPRCLASTKNRTLISSWNCLSSNNTRNQHSSSYCQKVALAVEPPAARESGSRIKLGILLGVIGGTVAITVLLGFLYVLFIKRGGSRSSSDGKDIAIAPSFADGLSFLGSPKSSIDLKRVPRTMRLPSLGLPPYHVYTLEEIENATNSFDPCNLLADVSQAQIYKAWLRDGSLVLVKCLKIKQRSLPQNLNQQMEVLAKVRHRHLVSILGHCVVTYQDHPNMSSTVFVVLEYILNGSLNDYLTDERKKEMIKWPQRMAIAIGIARGVQFLHTGVAPGIFGNDLKIDNIHLDESLIAKVRSYKIPLPFKAGPEGSPNRHNISDPKQAEKEDVYQLGTILLQIIVGKIVKSSVELDNLKQQLEMSLKEHPTELRSAIDPSIHGTYAFQSLKTTVELTVDCLATDPRNRPSIEDVLWNLQYSIQVQEGWTSSENLSTKM